jgi:hypothetical protein
MRVQASRHCLRSVLAGRDSWFGTRRCVSEFLHGLAILRAEEDFAFAGFGIHAGYLELERVLILIFLSCLSFLSHRLCRLFRALQAALEMRHTAENGSRRFGGWFFSIALGVETSARTSFHGCLTVLGQPLPDGRGSVTVTLISQGLPSRYCEGAVSVNQNPQNG